MNEYTFSSLKSFHSYRRLNLLRKKLDHLVSINFAHEFHERDHKYDGKGENCLLTIGLQGCFLRRRLSTEETTMGRLDDEILKSFRLEGTVYSEVYKSL